MTYEEYVRMTLAYGKLMNSNTLFSSMHTVTLKWISSIWNEWKQIMWSETNLMNESCIGWNKCTDAMWCFQDNVKMEKEKKKKA